MNEKELQELKDQLAGLGGSIDKKLKEKIKNNKESTGRYSFANDELLQTNPYKIKTIAKQEYSSLVETGIPTNKIGYI